ncbi:hypothetical protein CB0940_08786 [Cercospora beticola]|uniref:Uncharacterized protein n=1 Tax=Cercospora beticola TaxID=122368 RepID=A0A2G5HQE9_CERBT|nr:hypothetical protein CB0940_08786 [Cercospora beticola]PIA94771.1 hypothetical protein CB0940_08786 [Cercospora beticola]WPB05371.1 hypothetical protein RHO25_010023 [Cercospora beticola]
MDMPGGAALTAPNHNTNGLQLRASLSTIPRELRDEIYRLVGSTTPYQCRVCSEIVYGGDDTVKFETHSRTRLKYQKPDSSIKHKLSRWPHINHQCRVKTWRPCGPAHRITFLRINASDATPLHHAHKRRLQDSSESTQHTAQRAEFPTLAKVNQQLRFDVLSSMFLKSRLYGTVFVKEKDGAAILHRIGGMGQEAASTIRKLYVIYSKKKDYKYISNELLPGLKTAGVRVEDGVVDVVRLMQEKNVPKPAAPQVLEERMLPGCKCECCIVQFLREKDREARGVQRMKN